MRALGVLPPEPTEGFDGGVRETAPKTEWTTAEVEADHTQTVDDLATRIKQERHGA